MINSDIFTSSSESILSRIDAHLYHVPHKTAISFASERISYHELITDSNRLAHYLIALGIGRGDIVALCLDRSPNLIISLLAILKAGAAYLPLDPDYPKDRIEFMVEDSGAKTFITQSRLENKFDILIPKLLQEDISAELSGYSPILKYKPDASDLAYVLYTSGSTGKPKGVMIEHGSLSNFLLSMEQKPGINNEDIFLATTTISFDIAGLEIFLPLISGAELVLTTAEESRDGFALLSLIKRHQATLMQATPATWKMLLNSGWNEKLPIRILCGGEALSQQLATQLLNFSNELWNMYGPTETTIWSSVQQIKNGKEITIGTPIHATQFYIVNEQLEVLEAGEIGEIAIGGAGVARGYLNRDELSSQKFVQLHSTERIYLTGDLGYLNEHQQYVCLGRKDDQVKINGHRVELQEIEATLNQLPTIKESLVIVKDNADETHSLIAYLIENKNFNKNETIQYLRNKLPAYMVPMVFVSINEFPLTANGKVDKKQLPNLSDKDYLGGIYKAPQNELHYLIQNIWSDILHLQKEIISIDHNFFELGGTSLLTHQIAHRLDSHDISLSPTHIYQYPTIEQLSNFIEGRESDVHDSDDINKMSSGENKDIAVIGMAVRVPDANTIDKFWKNLVNGKENISFFSDDELDQSIPSDILNRPNYVKARGVLEDIDQFDPAFFGLTPKSAEMMDPQQRIFLEIAWEALEDGGYAKTEKAQPIGIFAGCSHNSYFTKNILHYPELIDQMGEFQVLTLNDKDYLSSRTAFSLNLTGPAVSVQSACSTSLLAITHAVDSIRKGQCTMALAGGIAINPPIKSGHIYQEGAIFSKDGHCRPFDAQATGTLFSDGGGAVLLKSKDQAIKDGDRIYSIIKGVGISNDGNNKGSFTAPSATGQAASIKMALRDGDVSASSISYIEAHGTATPLGDPIEIEGLKQAFGDVARKQYCYIGSVKSNFGHLTVAAGVAGFIKTCLSLYHREIPASINYTTPNPIINFQETPFIVSDVHRQWKSSQIRRAGVSSFGIGGTNVHVVIEENQLKPNTKKSNRRPFHLINWSAKTENSCTLYQNKLENFIDKQDIDIEGLSASLQLGKTNFPYRNYIIASNQKVLVNSLSNQASPKLAKSFNTLAFVFPGQGAQYSGMGKEIYEVEPVFREEVGRCAEILNDILGEDIRNTLFPVSTATASDKLDNTLYTQLALFVVEYALAKLWMSWGLKPTILIGHSVGEFVAAQIAGIFSLKDALYLIALRGELMAQLPEGNMLAVRTNNIYDIIPSDLDVAAINSPNVAIVAGSSDAIKRFTSELNSKGISNKLLTSNKAFHSRMVDPVMDSFGKAIENIQLNRPEVPILSTVTGTWLKESEAQSTSYWTSHLRSTVKFSDAISVLVKEKHVLAIEVGPKNTLTSLMRQQLAGSDLKTYASLGNISLGDYYALLDCIGSIWSAGYAFDWNRFNSNKTSTLITTPSYAFDRQSHWLEAKTSMQQVSHDHNIPFISEAHPNDDNNESKSANPISIEIKEIIEDISGLDLHAVNNQCSFIEMGLDSLLLTQLASILQKHFHVSISFRKLNEELFNVEVLADHISKQKENSHVLHTLSNK